MAPLLRVAQWLTERKATQTTKTYLETHFACPELRALLASQWGDYGLPPARSAFAIHALVVSHYLNGGWYPDGGAGRIARTFETGLERRGGSIRVAQEVVEILVEGRHATGVRVLDRRGPRVVERIYRAPVVISNAGASVTFETLLPTTGPVGDATRGLRALIGQLQTGLSVVTSYLRLKADVRTIGVNGENVWINTGLDHDDIAGQTRDVLDGRPRSAFVSFPSIKAGDERFHTAEIIALVDGRAFDAWRHEPKGNRGLEYSALKQRIGEGLIRLADTAIPGLAKIVEYSELATPLTVAHYTSHPGGRFYGLAATPERFRRSLLGPRTPVPGLYLSGQDACCLGVVGAMMGGVAAASLALGARGYGRIQAALKDRTPRSTEPIVLPSEKCRAVLSSKWRLTPGIWQVEFALDREVEDYAPGQFARLHVGDGEWRDYSIADLDGRTVRFLISTRTGGRGSQFIEAASVGCSTQIELPLGHYVLEPGPHRRIFVATGTGVAPFLPMFRELDRQGVLGDATLLFGCKTRVEDITSMLHPMPGTVIRCVSREPAPPGGVRGRVTHALADFDFDPDATDFYLCGASAMVADCKTLLENRGAKNLLTESF